MKTSTVTPRVWVGSWSDYNAGILHGEWIDVIGLDSDELQEKINSILADSPTAKREGMPAEEWSVFDSEGFEPFDIGEYSTVDDIISACDIIDESETDDRLGALIAFIDAFGIDAGKDRERVLSDLDNAYAGTFDSDRDFADDRAEAAGIWERIPEYLHPYFDLDFYARDLLLNDFTVGEDSEGNRHYFYRNW